MTIRLLTAIALVVLARWGFAQSANAPLNRDYYHLINRYELKQGAFSNAFHSAVKPYERKDIAAFIDTLQTGELSSRDRFNLDYLANDNWEWIDSVNNKSRNPFLKRFYRVKSDFYHVQTEDFDLHVNPVLYLQVGNEQDAEATPYINTRGVELRGIVGGKVGFYSFIGENQAAFPSYVRQWIFEHGAVPNHGFWKTFKNNGVDYFDARGYISFDLIKQINLQFGYDKQFIGEGYRSLILSDFANSYLFLKLNTKVWRINYTNLFTKMTADAPWGTTGSTGALRYPAKFTTFHRLGVNITDRLNIGLFESIIFGTPDSTGVQHYDVAYLNPIIFYRALEHQNGSIDNAVLGLDFSWILAKNYQVYGQLVLDEFLLQELRDRSGWWANKFAFQLGLKNVDFLNIPNLDIQLETNWARPYTYGHTDIYTNYAHYRQPLAHPLGANFKEYLAVARYQPFNRLTLEGTFISMRYGADSDGSNWGKNPMLPYTTREQDYENTIGQGIQTDVTITGLGATYQAGHNFFIDLTHRVRNLENETGDSQKSATTALAIRWNIPAKQFDF